MTHTPLADRYVQAKWHYNGRDGSRITHIGFHHIGGTRFDDAVEAWRSGTEQGSAHVTISNEGEIVAMLDEADAAWSFSNEEADNFSLVMEVENQTGGPDWLISDAAYDAAARVVADWRTRYGALTLWGHNQYAERSLSYPTYCPGPASRVDYLNQLALTKQNGTDDMYDDAAEARLMNKLNYVLAGIRREARYRLFRSPHFAALGRAGSVLPLSSNPTEAFEQAKVLSAINGLIVPADELAGSPVVLSDTAFFRLVDSYAPSGPFGYFAGNSFELTGGPTIHHRSTGDYEYPSRQDVWADLRPVKITYRGVEVTDFSTSGTTKIATLSDGRQVPLTATEVARADAQRATGQNWA